MAKAQDGKARKGKALKGSGRKGKVLKGSGRKGNIHKVSEARAKEACESCRKRKVRCRESCRGREVRCRNYEETQGVIPADSEAKLFDGFKLFDDGVIDPSLGDPYLASGSQYVPRLGNDVASVLPRVDGDAPSPEDFIAFMQSLVEDDASVLPHGDVDVSKDGEVVAPFSKDGEVVTPFSEDGEVVTPFSKDGEVDTPFSKDGEVDTPFSKDGEVDTPFSKDGEDVKALMNSLGEFATFAYPSGDFEFFSGEI